MKRYSKRTRKFRSRRRLKRRASRTRKVNMRRFKKGGGNGSSIKNTL